MSKRSKVVLIILVVVVLMIFLSVLKEEPSTEIDLENWEEEIVLPNNNLDPLNEDTGNSVFLLDFASKIEGFIGKVFSIIIGFVEGVIA